MEMCCDAFNIGEDYVRAKHFEKIKKALHSIVQNKNNFWDSQNCEGFCRNCDGESNN